MGVAIAPDGSLYIADHNSNRVRRVGLDGIITTVAGDGTAWQPEDGKPATEGSVSQPEDVTITPDGTLYILGYSRVRRVRLPDGIITTLAGGAQFSVPKGGDGGPATETRLLLPRGLAVGSDGSFYIANIKLYKTTQY